MDESDLRDLRSNFNSADDYIQDHGGKMLNNIHQERGRWINNEVPVDTGQLRRSINSTLDDFSSIFSLPDTHPYGHFVHDSTPWFDYSADRSERAVDREGDSFLDNVSAELTK